MGIKRVYYPIGWDDTVAKVKKLLDRRGIVFESIDKNGHTLIFKRELEEDRDKKVIAAMTKLEQAH